MARAAIIYLSEGHLGTTRSRPQNYYVIFLLLFYTILSALYLAVESTMGGLLIALVISCEVNICLSVNTPSNCVSSSLHYQSGVRWQWLPAVSYLGWLGKCVFRLWFIALLMTSWGSGPLSSPQCQLGKAMGSQHSLRKRSRRMPGIRAEEGGNSQGCRRLEAKECQAKGCPAHPYKPDDLGEWGSRVLIWKGWMFCRESAILWSTHSSRGRK